MKSMSLFQAEAAKSERYACFIYSEKNSHMPNLSFFCSNLSLLLMLLIMVFSRDVENRFLLPSSCDSFLPIWIPSNFFYLIIKFHNAHGLELPQRSHLRNSLAKLRVFFLYLDGNVINKILDVYVYIILLLYILRIVSVPISFPYAWLESWSELDPSPEKLELVQDWILLKIVAITFSVKAISEMICFVLGTFCNHPRIDTSVNCSRS